MISKEAEENAYYIYLLNCFYPYYAPEKLANTNFTTTIVENWKGEKEDILRNIEYKYSVSEDIWKEMNNGTWRGPISSLNVDDDDDSSDDEQQDEDEEEEEVITPVRAVRRVQARPSHVEHHTQQHLRLQQGQEQQQQHLRLQQEQQQRVFEEQNYLRLQQGQQHQQEQQQREYDEIRRRFMEQQHQQEKERAFLSSLRSPSSMYMSESSDLDEIDLIIHSVGNIGNLLPSQQPQPEPEHRRFSSSLSEWERIIDPATHVPYYFNHSTGISTWEMPIEESNYSQQKQQQQQGGGGGEQQSQFFFVRAGLIMKDGTRSEEANESRSEVNVVESSAIEILPVQVSSQKDGRASTTSTTTPCFLTLCLHELHNNNTWSKFDKLVHGVTIGLYSHSNNNNEHQSQNHCFLGEVIIPIQDIRLQPVLLESFHVANGGTVKVTYVNRSHFDRSAVIRRAFVEGEIQKKRNELKILESERGDIVHLFDELSADPLAMAKAISAHFKEGNQQNSSNSGMPTAHFGDQSSFYPEEYQEGRNYLANEDNNSNNHHSPAYDIDYFQGRPLQQDDFSPSPSRRVSFADESSSNKTNMNTNTNNNPKSSLSPSTLSSSAATTAPSRWSKLSGGEQPLDMRSLRQLNNSCFDTATGRMKVDTKVERLVTNERHQPARDYSSNSTARRGPKNKGSESVHGSNNSDHLSHPSYMMNTVKNECRVKGGDVAAWEEGLKSNDVKRKVKAQQNAELSRQKREERNTEKQRVAAAAAAAVKEKKRAIALKASIRATNSIAALRISQNRRRDIEKQNM
jgi:hypothetical protein